MADPPAQSMATPNRPDENDQSVAAKSTQDGTMKRTVSPTPEGAASSSKKARSIPATGISIGDHTSTPHPKLAEGFPPIALYHPSHAEVVSCVRSIATTFRDIHSRNEADASAELKTACQENFIQLLGRMDRVPFAGTVVLIGVTGRGKSSTVSSILQEPGVAWEGTDKRGTCVATYYQDAKQDQNKKFAVDVFFYHGDELQRRIKSIVDTYYDSLSGTVEEAEDAEDVVEVNAEDASRAKDSSASCLDDILVGSALFSSEDDKDADTYLRRLIMDNPSDYRGVAVTSIADAVLGVMGEAFGDTSTGSQRFDYDTVEEMHQATGSFARVNYIDELKMPSVWPLVRHINVHLHNTVVRGGLVLVDTPGLEDDNTWITANTESAMRSAGMMTIIHDALRPASEASVQAAIRKCISYGKLQDAILVLTKIDQIPRYSVRTHLSPAHRLSLESAERASQARETEARQARSAMIQASKAQDMARRAECAMGQLEADAARARAQTEYRAAELVVFSDRSKHSLAGTPGRDIDIHTISNKDYLRCMVEDQHDREITGVPSLRRKILRFAHRGRLRHIKTCARDASLAYTGVDAILNKDPKQRKDKMYADLNSRIHVRDLDMNFFAIFNHHVAAPLTAAAPGHIAALITKLRSLTLNIRPQTLNAFLKSAGVFKPGGSPKIVDWNDEMRQTFEQDVADCWQSLVDQCLSELQEFVAHVKSHFEARTVATGRIGVAHGFDTSAFIGQIQDRVDGLLESMTHELIVEFISSITRIGARLHGLEEPGALQPVLTPAYHLAQRIVPTPTKVNGVIPAIAPGTAVAVGGKATPARLNAIVNFLSDAKHCPPGIVRSDPLYTDLMTLRGTANYQTPSDDVMAVLRRRAREEFMTCGTELCQAIRAACTNTTDHIMVDFERRFDDSNNDVDVLSNEALEEFRDAIRLCKRVFKKGIPDHIKHCEDYEAANTT